MRREAQHNSWLVVGLTASLILGCVAIGGADREIDDGIDVYFRDTNLTALSDQHLETYATAEAGESMVFDRAFTGAPPQIPHTVEDMLPITTDSNECIDCHHPDNVASDDDRPLPKSHFSRAVMAKGDKGDAQVWLVKGYEDAGDVVGTRYDCTMCHTPQATNVDTPRSVFFEF